MNFLWHLKAGGQGSVFMLPVLREQSSGLAQLRLLFFFFNLGGCKVTIGPWRRTDNRRSELFNASFLLLPPNSAPDLHPMNYLHSASIRRFHNHCPGLSPRLFAISISCPILPLYPCSLSQVLIQLSWSNVDVRMWMYRILMSPKWALSLGVYIGSIP